jgi:citrate lyase beta subunit
MNATLDREDLVSILAGLRPAHDAHARDYPGAAAGRQPVHTVYGGAHLFEPGIAAKLGAAALRSLEAHSGDFADFARTVGLPGAGRLPRAAKALAALGRRIERDPEGTRPAHPDAWLAWTVHHRVREKLRREPVEDYRVDFEDGFGVRPDAEEDAVAAAAAERMAEGLEREVLPPFIGIRIKSLSRELAGRALRTLDLFVNGVLGRGQRRLPENFVVTLPKVVGPEPVAALCDALDLLEERHRLAAGTLRIELMIETPQAILGPDGRAAPRALAAAARGRCRGAHFGTYDYTAGLEITAAHQAPHHPACEFARHVLQVSLAGTGVTLSDGATTVMPVGPHAATRGRLGARQAKENREAVHAAWRLHLSDVRRSLALGYYQGWDLHPGQLVTRYAAVYSFFLEGLEQATLRLRGFVERAAQATRLGGVFDDAATGQALLNYFLRGLSCGALTEAEALATGLTLDELRTRSFPKILQGRRAG